MNDNEVNKIIAEYMGLPPLEVDITVWYSNYTRSLDALVEVWEKIGEKFLCRMLITFKFKEVAFNYGSFVTSGNTVQQAAAHATAKAIVALQPSSNDSEQN
jgi:hypothetical protein